uniref:Uncharacterized protein n=1 Tax=Globodera rostochiensis TaxID=31243 RepID=A0A914HD96_GLORO
MVTICVIFIVNFVATFGKSQRSAKSAANFVFLTFHNNSDHLYDVNFVVNGRDSLNVIPSLSLTSSKNGSKDVENRRDFLEQFPVMCKSDPRAPSPNRPPTNGPLSLWTAQTGRLSPEDGTLVSDGLSVTTVPRVSPGNSPSHRLIVCVFGDFSENLYEHTQLDLSKLIEHKKCNMNLFIVFLFDWSELIPFLFAFSGKIAWERRLHPQAGFNFSPYVMLHSKANSHKHSAFARVPSIFGAVGGNLTETTFFQSTEVGDVAFIQITVEIATVANLADGSVEYEMIAQYFRETMLNELECKLQEMHRRPRRPWIVLYMTHPYLVSNDEDKAQWFIMNDTDRFFDILKRYKVDLLTSCGIEGMARLLTKKKKEMPEAKLPEYVQTTMAQCGGYQSMDVTLQNECSFAVLDIRSDKMTFRKMNADDGSDLENGQIDRTFEEADDCVLDEEL